MSRTNTQLLEDRVVRHNTGHAFTVERGRHIRIEGISTCDFVCFNLHNPRERFDQARTKRNQGKVFITKGDYLISKSNNIMFTIVDDTFKEGTHDLQKGTCSRELWEKWGPWSITPSYWVRAGMSDRKRIEDLPDHGCWENLDGVLSGYGVAKEDIPGPFNIFQAMTIDAKGNLRSAGVKPKPGTYIEMRAEMDCLVGISACPQGGTGKDLRVQIY